MNTQSAICSPRRSAAPLTIVVSRESVVNSLLLAYAILTPLLVIPVAGLLGASDLLFMPAVAVALFVSRLRHCLTSQMLLLAFLALVGISLFQTRDFSFVLKWGRLIGISFPFFLACSSTLTLQQVIRAFFWSGLIAVLLGIGLWWFDVVLFTEEANQRLWLDNGESRVRAAGVFGNSTGYGALIAMWTVACGMLAITEKHPRKLTLAVILLTTLVGLAASTSRVALAAIMAGLLTGVTFLSATNVRRRGFNMSKSTISLLLIAVVVTLGTLCLVVPNLMDQQWLNVTYSRFAPWAHSSSNRFLAGRLDIWEHYLASINDWGILGVGYKQGHLHFSASPHNQFLSLAAECGVPCLCAYLLFVAHLVWHALRSRLTAPLESTMCMAIIAALIADGMGGEPLASWQITPVTMIMLGICVRRFSQNETNRSPQKPIHAFRAGS